MATHEPEGKKRRGRKGRYPADVPQLAGGSYVPAVQKIEADADPDALWFKLPIAIKGNCDHASTICGTAQCVTSWRQDYYVMFPRTQGGRNVWRTAFPHTEPPVR